jgi:Domain of Unknown Function (DUF928)
MQLALPETAKPLEVGKRYTWTLWIYCDADNPKEFLFVQGSIQRVATSATVPSSTAALPSLEKASQYAASGIWYDAVAMLADLHQKHPENQEYTAAWTSLLSQVDLQSAAAAPFSRCCQP